MNELINIEFNGYIPIHPESDRCIGCAFYLTGCIGNCENSQGVLPCTDADGNGLNIIWIKKETKE